MPPIILATETRLTHPVDQLSDDQLHDLLLRVDTAGFPADLEELWSIERLRYRETLRWIPPAPGASASLLDLGSSRPWLPFYQVLLDYQHIVLNTSYPESGFVTEHLAVNDAPAADVSVSVFDIERDVFPHADESFDTVLCLEVLEHLAVDPMAMMAEVNRVLKPGGTFVLTTPNAVRYSNVVNMCLGEHPQSWSPYNGRDTNRHNREYTPAEIGRLFRAAGLTPKKITSFGSKTRGLRRDLFKQAVALTLSPFLRCPPVWRRDVIIAAGHKTSACVDRRPNWLYFDAAEFKNEQNTQTAQKDYS